MITSPSKAKVVKYKTVWGRTIHDAMTAANSLRGWEITGNPAPMTLEGMYGTGITMIKITPLEGYNDETQAS